MAENTGITWTDSTFNPWIGCTKIGPGCDHCYAEHLMDTRLHRVNWGPGQPRKRTSAANWRQPLLWERDQATALEYLQKSEAQRQRFEAAAQNVCGPQSPWVEVNPGVIQCLTRMGKPSGRKTKIVGTQR